MQQVGFSCGRCIDFILQIGVNYTRLVFVSESRIKAGDHVNIQIFGKKKCFDTKKAERYFKERKIKYQLVDLPRFGMSKGELSSIRAAVGGLEQLVDEGAEGALLVRYLASEDAKVEKLLETPALFRTPIVRNGRQATVGYCPEIWKTWE